LNVWKHQTQDGIFVFQRTKSKNIEFKVRASCKGHEISNKKLPIVLYVQKELEYFFQIFLPARIYELKNLNYVVLRNNGFLDHHTCIAVVF
jgi:hypothetical protein